MTIAGGGRVGNSMCSWRFYARRTSTSCEPNDNGAKKSGRITRGITLAETNINQHLHCAIIEMSREAACLVGQGSTVTFDPVASDCLSTSHRSHGAQSSQLCGLIRLPAVPALREFTRMSSRSMPSPSMLAAFTWSQLQYAIAMGWSLNFGSPAIYHPRYSKQDGVP